MKVSNTNAVSLLALASGLGHGWAAYAAYYVEELDRYETPSEAIARWGSWESLTEGVNALMDEAEKGDRSQFGAGLRPSEVHESQTGSLRWRVGPSGDTLSVEVWRGLPPGEIQLGIPESDYRPGYLVGRVEMSQGQTTRVWLDLTPETGCQIRHIDNLAWLADVAASPEAVTFSEFLLSREEPEGSALPNLTVYVWGQPRREEEAHKFFREWWDYSLGDDAAEEDQTPSPEGETEEEPEEEVISSGRRCVGCGSHQVVTPLLGMFALALCPRCRPRVERHHGEMRDAATQSGSPAPLLTEAVVRTALQQA